MQMIKPSAHMFIHRAESQQWLGAIRMHAIQTLKEFNIHGQLKSTTKCEIISNESK